MLNEKNLNLAGWLSVIIAVLAFPLLIIEFISGMAEGKSAALLFLEALFNTGYVVIFVYIFIMLKHLLHEKADFHDVDKYITFLIWVNIAVTAVSVITLPFATVQEVVEIAILVLVIPLGIIYVVFGIKLLNCEDDLFGFLKPFSYLTVATGIMTAVVVLILFGMITAIISDVILALIFFKAAKLVQTQGSLAKA